TRVRRHRRPRAAHRRSRCHRATPRASGARGPAHRPRRGGGAPGPAAVGRTAAGGWGGSRAAARLPAARASGPVTVVAEGRERAALAGAPLATLTLSPDLAETLARWGVRTLGELAALPRAGLTARLGPAGLRAHELALGLDHDPFRPWTPPPFWEEAQGLEWEIDSLGVLAGVLETVLDRLCKRLASAALAADALEVRLGLASGGHHARDV